MTGVLEVQHGLRFFVSVTGRLGRHQALEDAPSVSLSTTSHLSAPPALLRALPLVVGDHIRDGLGHVDFVWRPLVPGFPLSHATW